MPNVGRMPTGSGRRRARPRTSLPEGRRSTPCAEWSHNSTLTAGSYDDSVAVRGVAGAYHAHRLAGEVVESGRGRAGYGRRGGGLGGLRAWRGVFIGVQLASFD